MEPAIGITAVLRAYFQGSCLYLLIRHRPWLTRLGSHCSGIKRFVDNVLMGIDGTLLRGGELALRRRSSVAWTSMAPGGMGDAVSY